MQKMKTDGEMCQQMECEKQGKCKELRCPYAIIPQPESESNGNCPCCKGGNVRHIKVNDNGSARFGVNFYSVILAYWLCDDCGVMFQKVTK